MRFEKLTAEVQELRSRNGQLTEERQALESELQTIRDENIELRAGARWPEWIVGGSILIVGGLLGMFFQWSSSRRTTRRIRL